jgi:hypothetical protein
MTQLTIRVPDGHIAEIAEAVAASYPSSSGVPATAAGVRWHILQNLREIVRAHKRRKAASQAVQIFDSDWGDLDEGRME